MSTTQTPVPPPQVNTRADAGDLYDAQRWETAYRELHDAPALLIQLQDDLSRARRREALWISVIVHLTVVILIINSPSLLHYLPMQSVVAINNNLALKDKDLTFLEAPPDTPKVTKRPDTNNISDKDRIATSKTRLDPKELKKILDSSRPGRPGPPAPDQQPSPAAPAVAQAPPPPQQSQQPANQNLTAKLNAPPVEKPQNVFRDNSLSAGSAIEQAARAALANRGQGYSGGGGDGGNYGLGQGRQATAAVGPMDVLSDTMGVDFGPYLSRVLHDVRQNWYLVIPESARPPIMKKGKVSIEFAILKDGTVAGLRYVGTSGDVALDRAAYSGINASNPFPPLPSEFKGQYLGLRFHFYYNPDAADLQ